MVGEGPAEIAGSFPTPCIFPSADAAKTDVAVKIAANLREPIQDLQTFYNLR